MTVLDILISVAVTIALLFGLLAAAPSGAATASSGNWATRSRPMGTPDRLYKYDFNSQNQDQDNVDWATSLVWTKKASVNKAKQAYGQSTQCVTRKEGRFKDDGAGASFEWDPTGDKGRKQSGCIVLGTRDHLRVYGDSDDRMWNSSKLYWVFGTTHTDTNDQFGWPYEQHASSDANRDRIYNRSVWGSNAMGWNWGSCYECKNMKNGESYRVEGCGQFSSGCHIWNNDKFASRLEVNNN